MLDISLPTANALFGLSNLALIIGGTLVLTGSVGVFWSGSIRDRFADERARGNETKTAVAVADSARANESNTRLQLELEKERVERLRLEQRVAPRKLSDEQRTKLVAGLRSSGWNKAEIMWHGAGEPESFARDIASVFESAGIATHVHTPGPFLPSAWGLMIVITKNGDSGRLKALFDEAGLPTDLAETNSTIGEKNHPTLIVGARED